MKKLFIILLLIGVNVYPSIAANLYINPDCAQNGDGTLGTCGSPTGAYNAIPTLASNNNYYILSSTRSESTDAYTLDINTKTNILIGAYYLNGSTPVHEVIGAKPIVYRSDNDGTVDSVVFISGSSNIHLINLDVRGGAGYGLVRVSNSDDVYFDYLDVGKEIRSPSNDTYGFYIVAGGTLETQTSGRIWGCNIVPDNPGLRAWDGIMMKGGTEWWVVGYNKVWDWHHNQIAVSSTDASRIDANYNFIFKNDFASPNEDGRGLTFEASQEDTMFNRAYGNYFHNLGERNQISARFNIAAFNITEECVNNEDINGSCQGWIFAGYAGPCQDNVLFHNSIRSIDEAGISELATSTILRNHKINNIIWDATRVNEGTPSMTDGVSIFRDARGTNYNGTYRANYMGFPGNNCGTTMDVDYDGTEYPYTTFNSQSGNDGDVIEDNACGNPQMDTDFSLVSISPAIDKGRHLTVTVGTSSGTTVRVVNSLFFQDADARWKTDVLVPDTICIETKDNCAQLVKGGIDRTLHDLDLQSSLTWSDGDKVYLQYNYLGELVWNGAYPDPGAKEYITATLTQGAVQGGVSQ